MKPLEAIRCTLPNCPCECFAPGKLQLRICDTCKHGWVAHALDKLGYRHMYTLGMQVEIVQPNIVFDIASLMLYGAQATPIRLKILLDRLFSVLQHEEVLQVLHGFGWSYEDYARGYILQTSSSGKSTPEQLPYKKRSEAATPPHPPPIPFQHFRAVRPISPNYQNKEETSGRVLDKWTIASREEEHIILQQFLRFGETKSIAQEIILQDTKEKQQQYISQTARAESEIKKFIERTNSSMQGYIRPFDSRHMLSGRVPYVHSGSRLMAPASTLHSYTPVTPGTELRSPSVPLTNSTPLSTSPLGRLQTMQPFDYRREQVSPAVSPGAQEKRAPLQSPPQQSPQNFSIVTSSALVQPTALTQKTLELKEEPPVANSVPMVSPDDSTNDAINYSTKDHDLNSLEQDRKSKHLRKAVNPVKRSWTPSGAFGSTLVSPSGKKRVLCTACNKTFCDKGALKIHYSAVHLKEMHKCTVEGCNMMFSSRRSRNRHSANPNPKLHMPQKRKIEGSNLIGDSKGSGRLPTMVVSSSYVHHSPDSDHSLGDNTHDVDDAFFTVDSKLSFLPTPEKKLKLDLQSEEEMMPDSSMISRHRMSRREEHKKHELSSSRGSRRKSNAPTRCAQTEEMFALSDDNAEDREHGHDGQKRKKLIVEEPLVEEEQEEGIDADDDSDDEGQSVEFEDPTVDMSGDKENLVVDESDEPQNLSTKGRETRANSSKGSPSAGYPKIVSLLTNKPSVDMPMDLSAEVHKTSLKESTSIGSDQESVESDCAKLTEPDLSADADQPLDKDNPKRCPACGKVFQNIFGVKTHYRNVHLKVMHECTIEGCTASFPSKRSRDRHSSNVNLHHKMMVDEESSEKTNGKHKAEDEDKENEDCEESGDEEDKEAEDDLDGEEEKSVSNVVSSSDSSSEASHGDENASPKQKADHCYTKGKGKENGAEEELDENDETVHCHICEEKFRDNLALKEHFESIHPKEMFRCTVKGCDKIFSTRKSRNRHSHNDNLHRYMATAKTNGVS
ncbi:zinc finger protein basonuclin-2-like isoform X2 [Liolophura sinensis]|uniref:zinc finger protein basonuclin-2-like isoform X2 n=1 Tax=Liolophura sinensis TaxID=3198878 RepID=UPI003158D1DF